MDSCVKLVTVHGRPFSMLEDDGFKELIDMIDCEKEENDQVIQSRSKS